MSNSRFAVVGLCVAAVACGEQLLAHPGSVADGGASSAGRGDTSAAGEAEVGARAGASNDNSAGAAGAADAGDPGTETGGVAGLHNAGGTGGMPAHAGGGTFGLGGAGGALIEPILPPLGMVLWLRADRGVQNKDGHVQAWQDQSGNQTNATQPTANVRPAYLPTGFNGRPTLEFNGQGQFLKFAAGFGDFGKGLAGFVVAKPTKTACASILEFSNGMEIEDISVHVWEDKWSYEVGSAFIQTGHVDQARFSLYSVNHRMNGNADLRIGSSVIGTLQMPLPVLPTSGVRENNFVGHTLYGEGCEYFTGQISEIILYSRSLTINELTTIENYLDAHWALADQDAPPPAP